MARTLVVGLICLTLTGCYRATIESGMPAGSTTVEEEWAHSWLGGLVPPSEIDVARRCPRGIARVVTQHSFVNQVAAILTGGIYTPMHITVTCAARSDDEDAAPAPAASPAEASATLDRDGVVYLDLDG